jgi:DNA polymerase III subunit alpha
LEPGTALVLNVLAEAQGDEVRLRLQEVERLDDAARRVAGRAGLRVFLRDAAVGEGVAKRLDRAGEADISLVLGLTPLGREVEVKLPGRYLVTPQIQSALKAVPGVLAIQEM